MTIKTIYFAHLAIGCMIKAKYTSWCVIFCHNLARGLKATREIMTKNNAPPR